MQKGQKYPVEVINPDEARAMIAKCSGKCPTGVRNRALIATLYRAGLRISEALGLYPRDLNAEAGTLRIRHGKGDRARVVAIDTGALAIIQLWLERRAALGVTARQPIFCTLSGEPMKVAYVNAMLKRIAKRAGIERRVHSHAFRHSHAYELASEGVPVHIIKDQLGHASLETTFRYINHLNPTERIERLKAREWRL